MEIVHKNKLDKVEDVINFMFAGKAIFTLRNSKSGNRFTYRISAPKKQDQKRPVFFVAIMTGSDNEKSYQFAGTLFGKFTYQHSRKSKLALTHKAVDVFSRFLDYPENGTLPGGIEIWHEGCCGRCGRKLTVPASILSGIGPECSAKRWREANAQLKLTLKKD